jgi:hypothetical protein
MIADPVDPRGMIEWLMTVTKLKYMMCACSWVLQFTSVAPIASHQLDPHPISLSGLDVSSKFSLLRGIASPTQQPLCRKQYCHRPRESFPRALDIHSLALGHFGLAFDTVIWEQRALAHDPFPIAFASIVVPGHGLIVTALG